MNYNLKKDIEGALDYLLMDIVRFSEVSGIPKRTIFDCIKNGNASSKNLEKIYNAIYELGVRYTVLKSEIFEEELKSNEVMLYHGSKFGLDGIVLNGSRDDCDFGSGFYLTKSINSSISFVESYPGSSIYCFKLNTEGLKIYEFQCDLEWMLVISFFRNKIPQYKDRIIMKNILEKIKDCDILVGPIADNKMFEVLNEFASGLITTDQAIHALSASRLGKQYFLKSSKAHNKLVFVERLYICEKEKQKSFKDSIDRENIVQTKLDFSKRNYRNKGKYIDEVFK